MEGACVFTVQKRVRRTTFALSAMFAASVALAIPALASSQSDADNMAVGVGLLIQDSSGSTTAMVQDPTGAWVQTDPRTFNFEEPCTIDNPENCPINRPTPTRPPTPTPTPTPPPPPPPVPGTPVETVENLGCLFKFRIVYSIFLLPQGSSPNLFEWDHNYNWCSERVVTRIDGTIVRSEVRIRDFSSTDFKTNRDVQNAFVQQTSPEREEIWYENTGGARLAGPPSFAVRNIHMGAAFQFCIRGGTCPQTFTPRIEAEVNPTVAFNKSTLTS
jgi:hypothetical protein